MRLCWFLLCLMVPLSSHALDVSSLGRLPVMHEGRIKPLVTLAQLEAQRLETETAPLELLAQMLFAPGRLFDAPIIPVPRAEIRGLLALEEREEHRYSYNEITPRLKQQRETLSQLANKDTNSFTANEQALWQLYETIDAVTQLTGGLSLLLPLELPLTEALRERFAITEQAPYDYFTLSRYQPAFQQAMQALIRDKGGELEGYTPDEQALALLSMRLAALQSTGQGNQLLRLIPTSWSEVWLSPWQVLQSGKASDVSAALMQQWQQLALAYQTDDQSAWDAAMTNIVDTMQARPEVSATMLQLEQLYHELDIMHLSWVLYLAATALAALALWRRRGVLFAAAATTLWLSLVTHAAALAMRMAILGRPPVTSLYESIVFVAFITALVGAVLGRKLKEAYVIGAALAAFLLAISGTYAGQGDPMGMPIAVLNTNFWLATHVICITAGYGAALMAGVLAHLALASKTTPAWRYLNGAALLALLLTAVGTILGGVWADQSWGRFWGWDPKENGALMIVLWLVWLLHGRMTTHVGQSGFAALLACTPIIVALSWFGVNLLGVGLHSYGFTSEAALGLFGFCGAELVLVTGLYLRSRRRHG